MHTTAQCHPDVHSPYDECYPVCRCWLYLYHCNSCPDIYGHLCMEIQIRLWYNRLCHAHSFRFITKVVDRIFNILLSIARQKFDARLLAQHRYIIYIYTRYNVRLYICCGNNVWQRIFPGVVSCLQLIMVDHYFESGKFAALLGLYNRIALWKSWEKLCKFIKLLSGP